MKNTNHARRREPYHYTAEGETYIASMHRKQNPYRQVFPGGIWGTLCALHPIPAVHPGLCSGWVASFRMTGKTLRLPGSLACSVCTS